MNKLRLVCLTSGAAFLIGCATDKPLLNPFKVPREEVQQRVKVVVVAPLSVDIELPNAKATGGEFATLLIAELNSIGFQTIPPSEYEQVFNRLRDEAGGFFDPLTGKTDKDKFLKVQEQCRQEMAAKYHADAILYSSIKAHSAQFNMNVAHWDGVQETVFPGGTWTAAAFRISAVGDVPALSLYVTLEDIAGKRLYVDCGGLQLLAKAKLKTFVPVPPEDLLTNHTRNANAVRIAMSAFHAPAGKHD
ncbi:MAG TPA: hypothetical protein VLZ12_15245 [Verrucomicrobiae bacterium]|nr:hypothetical protein [Verrucomicrobiae bacterium]